MERCLATIRFTIALRRQQKLGVIRFIKSSEVFNSFGSNLSGKSTLIAPAREPSPAAISLFLLQNADGVGIASRRHRRVSQVYLETLFRRG
jgi:hypothetical protein